MAWSCGPNFAGHPNPLVPIALVRSDRPDPADPCADQGSGRVQYAKLPERRPRRATRNIYCISCVASLLAASHRLERLACAMVYAPSPIEGGLALGRFKTVINLWRRGRDGYWRPHAGAATLCENNTRYEGLAAK